MTCPVFRKKYSAWYAYHYDRKHKRLRAVDQPQIHKTVFADPQLELWELDDAQWRKIVERVARPRRTKPAGTKTVEQGMGQLIEHRRVRYRDQVGRSRPDD
jgi:hypothetical protein